MSKAHKSQYFQDKGNEKVTIWYHNNVSHVLDITNSELDEFKKNYSKRCGICGKYETANTRPDIKNVPNNLCIDHNHNTMCFRGFLCVQCNRNMGWYDKYRDQIFSYDMPFIDKIKK